MIKECNFKEEERCTLSLVEICPKKENCILYQTYKNTLKRKPKTFTGAPKQKHKPINYTKSGRFRHPPSAMKKLLREVKDK